MPLALRLPFVGHGGPGRSAGPARLQRHGARSRAIVVTRVSRPPAWADRLSRAFRRWRMPPSAPAVTSARRYRDARAPWNHGAPVGQLIGVTIECIAAIALVAIVSVAVTDAAFGHVPDWRVQLRRVFAPPAAAPSNSAELRRSRRQWWRAALQHGEQEAAEMVRESFLEE